MNPSHFFRVGLSIVSWLTLGPRSQVEAADTFKATGSLASARRGHAATLLQNGRVLVTGGVGSDGSSEVATAELFDPTTGQWGAAPGPATPRHGHTSILLPSGNVLVTGGSAGASFLSSCEVYVPTADVWRVTGPMVTARRGHTATLLADGRVLLCGGVTNMELAAAEIYDPATGLCLETGAMATGRHSHTATLLPSGQVLVAGGRGAAGSLATAELFDPAVGTWSATGPLAGARGHHSATLLPGGKVLVVGGSDDSGATLSSAEVYDSGAGAWTPTGPLAIPRQAHTAVLLPNGKVHIQGGKNSSGLFGAAERYDPTTGTWSGGGTSAFARSSQAATLLPTGAVLLSGGETQTQAATVTTEVFEYATSKTLSTIPLAAAGANRRATLLADGKVLICGGDTAGQQSIAQSETYDFTTGISTPTSPMRMARLAQSATLLPNSKVLVVGGLTSPSSNSQTASAELFDPVARTWTLIAPLAIGRAGHSAAVLPNGKVLVAGGLRNPGAYEFLDSAELYDPATNTWSDAGKMKFPSASHDAILLPTGLVMLLGHYQTELGRCQLYDPAKGTWSEGQRMLRAREGYSTTLLPNGKLLTAGGIFVDPAVSELYDPVTGTWAPTGSLGAMTGGHTATLLHTGEVFVRSYDPFHSGVGRRCERYNPLFGSWSPDATSNTREAAAAILLPNNKVLIAGGRRISPPPGFLVTAEIYDPGLGYTTARQPLIASAAFDTNGRLSISGSGFRGMSNASGSSGQGSTDYPLVLLRRLDSQQSIFLLSDPEASWSDTSFRSAPLGRFPPGHASLTVITSGIPSTSTVIRVPAPEVELSLDSGAPLEDGASVPFGTAHLGEEALVTFTVKNAGNGALSGIGITIEGPHSASFNIATSPADSLPPLGTTQFTLRFSPTTPGPKTATLRLVSNDLDEGIFDLELAGRGFNSPPTVTGPGNLTITEDTSSGPLTFVVGDAETSAELLSVTWTSSDPTILPNSAIVLGGSGAQRTVTLTPTPNRSGTTTITMTVNDGELQTSSNIALTVLDVNDPPTLDAIPSPAAILESAGAQVVTIGGINVGALETQSPTVTATSDNAELMPNPTVSYTSPNSNGNLTYTPVAGASGRATITVTVSDGQELMATVTRTFVVVVTPQLRVTGAQLAEGNNDNTVMSFSVEVGSPAAAGITVQYATVPGSAVAGSDFTAVSGVATIPAGSRRASIDVEIIGDLAFEAHETFFLALSDPANATLSTPSVTGTIINNDAPPSLALSNPTVTESSEPVTFNMWLRASIPEPLAFPVAWLVSTRSDSAQAGSDFNEIGPTPLTFAPGETTKWVAVAITGHSEDAESDEQFFVDFTAESGPAPEQAATCTIKRLAVTHFLPLGNGVYAIRFPTGVGQTYVIQEARNLAGPWVDNSSILIGSGSVITQVVFSEGVGAFFRVVASPDSPGLPAVGP